MSKRTAKLLIYIVTAICVLGIAMHRQSATKQANNEPGSFTQLEGTVFHTVYHIQYEGSADYHDDIKQLFREFDGSLSMFNDTSIISRINRCDTSVVVNDYVRTVLEKSLQVSELTQGAYDITVAPLVNLWGFGFKNADGVSQHTVDSILQFVGYEKIHLTQDGHVLKDDPRIILDASSIAKGYMCDVVADYLRSRDVSNFMVEIGGEITCGGHNSKGKLWSVGINEPIEDSLSTSNVLRDIMHITDCSVATSGNYRNFYYKDGRRYAHIIDPHTGYPAQYDILSSTVVAPNCITADALATSFMVLGSQRSLRILEADTTLMAYFICSDPDSDHYKVIYSPKLKNMLSSQNKSN